MPNANAAHAECEAEKDARDQPDAAGHEVLRVNDDRGESREQNQPDDHGKHRRPEQVGVRQQQ
jgi:hypothetical protein